MKKLYHSIILKALYSIIIQLCCATVMFAATTVNSQGLAEIEMDIQSREYTLRQAFDLIEERTDLKFFYVEGEIDVDQRVEVSTGYQNLKQILQKISNDKRLEFRRINDIIVVKQVTQKGPQVSESFYPVEISVSGKVTDSETGEPLVGVTVVVPGTSHGTITDADGHFQLELPDDSKSLIFSFVGFERLEVPLQGQTYFSIAMTPDIQSLQEIVVTALNIERNKEDIGYALQDVKGDEVAITKQQNVSNALAGRIAGVFVTQGGGELGDENTRIVIRGENVLSGSNQPLFVIDGIPGDMNSVAPNDIESISVLKGPSGAALYGSRATNGVVLITTKRGDGKGSGFNVEFSSNLTFQRPSVTPDYQTAFGQGIGGNYNAETNQSWGAAFNSGTDTAQLWNENAEWKAHPDNFKNFYETGIIATHNLALIGGSENQNYRLSYTNIRQKGMVPNTDFKQDRLDLVHDWFFNEKLSAKSNIKLINQRSDNNRGYDPSGIPLNVDIEDLKTYRYTGGAQRIYRVGMDNPYFVLHEDAYEMNRIRVVGNLQLSYDITDNLSFFVRGGINGLRNKTAQKLASGHLNNLEQYGGYQQTNDFSYERNADFLLTYQKAYDDFSFRISAGGNSMLQHSESFYGENNQLLVPGVYAIQNYRNGQYATTRNDVDKGINSLYGFAYLSYQDKFFLDLTARNDWSSTLPEEENSYFYPSVAASAILSEVFDLPQPLSFLKLRANFAQVGNDAEAFLLQDEVNFTRGDGIISQIAEGSTKREFGLKPELTTGFEVGTNIQFFNNRLGLDLTYYNSNTRNQIWPVAVSSITGYNFVVRNAGEIENNGIELILNATPVKAGDFVWNTTVNFARDRAYVRELDPENPELIFTSALTNHLFVIDQVDQRRGNIYSKTARRFEYDADIHDPSLAAYNGELYFDSNKDLPRSDELTVIGNYNPDWIGSLHNSFSYKGITLGVLFTTQQGNDFYAGVEKNLVGLGLDETTGGNRDAVLPSGIWDSPEGPMPFEAGEEITAEVFYGDYMTDGEINDIWVKDGSFVKLKELSISYRLPETIISKTPFSSVELSLFGRNLMVWSDVKHVDPEALTLGRPGISTTGGVAVPKTWGYNLLLKF
ncbi:SusC/RagA family TonB-linked outer membrane protein [Fulvivirga kasyanovii]|uniref:SusC/RagA family TonB-linked outer membrane protein n=1 Tax=Fulvivirga kasyanovii TaxID=396812 RepID=A0ABW9RTY2_9BACT|nr:SusC/RagA family TonB-linked outer membrane protein [Fulvivirga kasyanovii]MTI26445.1 SusC/RagA family TonB-linked outer membrane protein [Fulvivirga kasyanovii]